MSPEETHVSRKNARRTFVRRMEKILEGTAFGEVEVAARWYSEARAVAQEVADVMDISLEAAASVVSAYSPRVTWSRNVTLAVAHAQGSMLPCLGSSRKAALRAQVDGFDALSGPKTNAFARAIAGDDDAVVVDMWICRAAGVNPDRLTPAVYEDVAQSVRTVARRHGLSPATAQALIWIRVRGKAA